MRRPDADLEEKREPRVVSSAGAQKGDRIKPSGRSLTLAAIEKRPSRAIGEPAESGGSFDLSLIPIERSSHKPIL
jgi:hypothetical protein